MRSLRNRYFWGLAACAIIATVGLQPTKGRPPGYRASTYAATIQSMTAGGRATSGRARPELLQDPSWGTPTGVNYPKLGGNLGNDDYSSLSQIDTGNVQRLGGAWETDLEIGGTVDPQEGTPVVYNGRMFVPTSQRDLYALNATTGTVDWEYKSGFPSSVPSSLRGATVGNGMVFSSFGAEHVVALDQSTGHVDWSVQLGDSLDGLPAAMVFYNNMLFIGTSNSGTQGGRGEVFALDATNGKVLWSFYSTPRTGQANNGSWEGNSWETGGGGAWMHPAIDPTHHLIYWTLGDPEPRSNGSQRAGSDLYTDSIVALNITTGKLSWYFQSVHHDIWDYDNVMAPVLADIHVHGKLQPAVFYGSKTGMMFVLNRVTGKPLLGVNEVPVPQDPAQKTAATQPFPRGQAYVPLCPTSRGPGKPVPNYQSGCIFTPFNAVPVITAPGTEGGGNWSADSFDPNTGLLYIGASILNTAHTNGSLMTDIFRPIGEDTAGRLVALDPRTNTVAWSVPTSYPSSAGQGIITTAGGLLVQGEANGDLVVRNVKNGRELWRFQTGAGISSTAITYAVGGYQYLAVFAGAPVAGATAPAGAKLWAFRLDATTPQRSPIPTSRRVPVTALPVYGSTESNTITLGRIWNYTTGTPGTAEEPEATNAMAPQSLIVSPGTTVRFVNPAGNLDPHGADEFFGSAFDTGLLGPGQSSSIRLTRPGTYYYNDPDFPQNTGVITVASPNHP